MTRPTEPTPSCLACGDASLSEWATAVDMEYRSSEDRFTFLKCASCGALSISPVPSDRLEDIYPPNYYSFGQEQQSVIYKVKDWLDRRMCASLLATVPGADLNALDVGGGDGEQLDVVRASDSRVGFTQVVDMDVAAEARATAKGHAYHQGLIQDYESDKTFDFVLLLNVIEHVDNPEEVLRKVSALLSAQGVVLVKTPNIDSLDVRMYSHKNWGGYHCPRHWVLFDEQSFRAIVERAGLAVRSFRYTQGAPFWAMSWLFVLAKHGLVSITPERPATSHPLFPLFTVLAAGFDIIRGLFGAKTSQMIAVLAHPKQ